MRSQISNCTFGAQQGFSMFNLFKPRFHEPVEIQKAEVRKLYGGFVGEKILRGANCDRLPNRGDGSFGKSHLNPIPVNGGIGTLRYFWKLRTLDGWGLLLSSDLQLELSGFSRTLGRL